MDVSYCILFARIPSTLHFFAEWLGYVDFKMTKPLIQAFNPISCPSVTVHKQKRKYTEYTPPPPNTKTTKTNVTQGLKENEPVLSQETNERIQKHIHSTVRSPLVSMTCLFYGKPVYSGRSIRRTRGNTRNAIFHIILRTQNTPMKQAFASVKHSLDSGELHILSGSEIQTLITFR
jgi:hypothetical protein